jgi:hypothetical protein
MSTKSELMAVGNQASTANRLGFDPVTAFTAAGTTQGTATALTANNAKVTTASDSAAGVILGSSEQKYMIYNVGPSVLTIYPAVGTAFAGLAANAGIQVAATGAATIECNGLSGHTWNVSP